MPRFKYSEFNRDPAPEGVHLAQVVKATQRVSKTSGNEMIALSLRTIPDSYWLNYYLVFSGKDGADGLISQFCRHCEGPLRFPEDPQDDLSVTATDCLHRLIFVDVEHEGEGENLQAKVKLAGILSRAKALAMKPELADVKLPANVPPPQDLAVLPKEEKPVRRSGSAGALPPPDDDIPF
jgi:hypothetical protein